MPRADSLLHDPRWPGLAARITSTSARELPLARLATEHGIVLRRLERAVRTAGLLRLELEDMCHAGSDPMTPAAALELQQQADDLGAEVRPPDPTQGRYQYRREVIEIPLPDREPR